MLIIPIIVGSCYKKTDYNFKNNSEARRVFYKEICDTEKTQLIDI